MGLMLAVVRKIQTGDHAIRAGQWAARTQTSMDVFGSTVGIVGLGQIAKAFVRRARAFGTRILVHTRTHDAALAEELGFQYATLEDVLRESDIVSLFASLTNETRRMIGARELSLMKRSAYLINIARGELVDRGICGRAAARRSRRFWRRSGRTGGTARQSRMGAAGLRCVGPRAG